MNDIAIWLFAAAAYGTVAFPFVVGVAAWRAPAGRRRRRALVVTGWWVAFCVVAGVLRLFTNDGYYSPDHITYWEHSSDGVRRGAVLLLIAAGSAAAIALAAARRRSTGLVTAAAVVGIAWSIDVAMLVWAVGLGVH